MPANDDKISAEPKLPKSGLVERSKCCRLSNLKNASWSFLASEFEIPVCDKLMLIRSLAPFSAQMIVKNRYRRKRIFKSPENDDKMDATPAPLRRGFFERSR